MYKLAVTIRSLYCRTRLPLASTRWVQSTFSSLCPLFSNQCHRWILARSKIFWGNAKNRTRGPSVRSKNDASVPCYFRWSLLYKNSSKLGASKFLESLVKISIRSSPGSSRCLTVVSNFLLKLKKCFLAKIWVSLQPVIFLSQKTVALKVSKNIKLTVITHLFPKHFNIWETLFRLSLKKVWKNFIKNKKQVMGLNPGLGHTSFTVKSPPKDFLEMIYPSKSV